MTPSASNNFQTPVPIAFSTEPQTGISIGNVVENSTVGNLKGDLWMAKDGKIVVNDSDWRGFDLVNILYDSDNVILISGIDVGDFQIGDKVYIVQGSDKYFYITEVDTSTKKIYIDAGDDYTFTDDSFSYFGISRLSSPSGHPTVFAYDPDVFSYQVPVWTDRSSVFTNSAQYSMTGRLVFISFTITTASFPSSATALAVGTPLRWLATTGLDPANSGLLTQGGTSAGDNFVRFWFDGHGSPLTFETGIDIVPMAGGTFNSGNLSFVGSITVSI